MSSFEAYLQAAVISARETHKTQLQCVCVRLFLKVGVWSDIRDEYEYANSNSAVFGIFIVYQYLFKIQNSTVLTKRSS